MCLEFSKIDNELLNFFYKNYSKLYLFRKIYCGIIKPYEYLINSIDDFYNQEQLLELITKNGFLM
jgi:demethylmenaquinone methyltransferase/2-methoxy-6-polyprenyl-1,4-benzoquinol methylase